MHGVDREDYAHHPAHANTEPSKTNQFNATPNPSYPSNGAESSPSDITAVDEKDSNHIGHVPSNDVGTRSMTDTQPNAKEHSHGPRKRLKFMGILGQPDRTGTQDSDDSERTDSGDTKKKRRRHIPAWTQFKSVMFGSWVNVLLICVPVGFAVRYAHANGYAIFIVNFIAIVPLAALLSFATEELALYVGETLGGLLNASFGNATELIGMFLGCS